MSGKQPVGVTPITVPTVGIITTGGVVEGIIVGQLTTSSGPTGIEGRHAHLILTPNQAEVLVREMAAKLGLTIVDPTSTLSFIDDAR